jgi:hypothetical protein
VPEPGARFLPAAADLQLEAGATSVVSVISDRTIALRNTAARKLHGVLTIPGARPVKLSLGSGESGFFDAPR